MSAAAGAYTAVAARGMLYVSYICSKSAHAHKGRCARAFAAGVVFTLVLASPPLLSQIDCASRRSSSRCNLSHFVLCCCRHEHGSADRAVAGMWHLQAPQFEALWTQIQQQYNSSSLQRAPLHIYSSIQIATLLALRC